MATSIQIAVDCADPARLAGFWAEALGYKVQDPPEGYATWPEFLADQGVPESEWNMASAVVDPDGSGPRFYFQRVPEPKTVKNRVHVDLNISGGPSAPRDERHALVDAEAERLVAAGASRLYTKEELGIYWITLADPEGNEFCVH